MAPNREIKYNRSHLSTVLSIHLPASLHLVAFAVQYCPSRLLCPVLALRMLAYTSLFAYMPGTRCPVLMSRMLRYLPTPTQCPALT